MKRKRGDELKTIQKKILGFLKHNPGNHTLKNIAQALSISRNKIKAPLRRLVKKELILNPQKGLYCYRTGTAEKYSATSGNVTTLAPEKSQEDENVVTEDVTALASAMLPKDASKIRLLPCKSIVQRIVKFLEESIPEEYNAKTIALLLKINYNTAKDALARLAKNGKIVRAHHGFYRAKISAEDLKKIEEPLLSIHGPKIECCIPDLASKWEEGISLTQAFMPTRQRHENIITTTMWFEMRRVTVTFHKKGLVEIFCSTSECPMDYVTFTKFVSFVDGLLHIFGSDLYKANARLRQIGLNYDYRALRLDGVNSIKLQTFHNAWAQIYNKGRDYMRIEEHMVMDISLAEAVTILSALQPIYITYPKPEKDKHGMDYVA